MSIALETETGGPQGGRAPTRWQLVWIKFTRHRVAAISLGFIIALYGIVLVAEFVAPYGPFERNTGHLLAPPTGIQFIDNEGQFHLRPFVYGLKNELDRTTFQRHY